MQKDKGKAVPPVTAPEPAKPNPSGGFKKFLRRCYRVVKSTLGLLILLIAYSFIGAALFQFLEGGHEDTEKVNIRRVRQNLVDRFFIASRNTSITDEMWRDLVKHELHVYEGELHEAFAHGISTDSTIKQWDFWGSFLFCATVYTTIGYGHIAPATDAGRCVCVIYAIIGIPLCLIVMADLGKLFTRGLKFAWSYVRRFYYTGNCAKKPPPAKSGTPAFPSQAKLGISKTKTTNSDVYVVDDEFNLPPIVAIAVAIVYILVGAALYIQWESWTYLEAFYFLFISVSTIGFGDVLPDHPRYFLATSLYVLIGLSLVAMVINVIMESLSTTITRAKERVADVGKTIGIPLEDLLADIEEEEYEEKQRKLAAAGNQPNTPSKNGTKK